MSKLVDNATRDIIVKLHKNGAKLGEIANQVPFSVDVVRKVLKASVAGYGKPATVFTDEMLRIIALEVSEGASVAAQAAKYGITRAQLRYRLEQGGYDTKKRKCANFDTRSRIVELRTSGKTLQQIADTVGLSRQRVCEYLNAAISRGELIRDADNEQAQAEQAAPIKPPATVS